MTVVDNSTSFKALNRRSWTSWTSKASTPVPEKEEAKSKIATDWPNEPGFDWQDEVKEPVELNVTGTIPEYVRGVLYRTGPGGDSVTTESGQKFKIDHWFDGFTLNHRFEIAEDKVIYRSRRACDELLEYARKSGMRDSYSFGQKRDPCESFFRKVTSSFQQTPLQIMQTNPGTEHPSCLNIGVTLSANMPGAHKLPGVSANSSSNGHGGIATLVAKTDANQLQVLDPETLEPIGIARQTALHPDLDGQLSAAHARTCPETGNFYNFNLKLEGPRSAYRIFKITPEGEVSIIASVLNANPAYIHSFFLSGKYVILCVWGSKLSWGGVKVVWNRNICDAIAPFDPNAKAKFYVIDKTGEKGLVATYETDNFFAFHTVNAYEDGGDIVLDVPIYNNLDILHILYYSVLRSESSDGIQPSAFRTEYTRFRLTDIPETADETTNVRTAKVEFRDPVNMELPVINPKYITKPHRYMYAISVRGKSSWVDGLVKHDTATHKTIYWEKHGHSPSEPIFIADPNGKDEDDGTILTVVLDGHSVKSYLLVLNAKDLTEIARADMETVVSFGFHGTYVGTGKPAIST